MSGAPTFPAERIIGQIIGDPGKGRQVAAEIDRVQSGEVKPIAFHLDPLTACLVISYLNAASRAIGPVGSDRTLITRIIAGLEREVALSCPALAGVMAKARKKGDEPRG